MAPPWELGPPASIRNEENVPLIAANCTGQSDGIVSAEAASSG